MKTKSECYLFLNDRSSIGFTLKGKKGGIPITFHKFGQNYY